MIKSFTAFRIGPTWKIHQKDLEDLLFNARFSPCTPSQEESVGWVAPRGHGSQILLENINSQWIAKLMVERKSVPGSALSIELENRCKELELQRGAPVGRKERKDLKEQIKQELLPRAFAKRSSLLVWIDLTNRLLIVGTSSANAADQVLRQVLQLMASANNPIPLTTLRTIDDPAAAMSTWLVENDAPAGFSIDRDVELRSTGENVAVVRYVHHPLDIAEIGEHIRGGKVPTQLAMTWDSRVSFVLTDSFAIKNIVMLDDVFKDQMEDEAKSFDADITLVTGELARLIPDLVDALGGEKVEDDNAASDAEDSV